MSDEKRPGAQLWVPERVHDLAKLRESAEECRGCELWEGATHVVFSTGTAKAAMMLVGEQPGDREDREGAPFVGPAGKVLDHALAEAGIARDSVYLTNAVKHFRNHSAPRGKRRIHDKPSVAHILACHPWLSAEVDVVKPEVIVCLGASAGRSVLGRPVRITEERGEVFDSPAGDGIRILLTTHPSALLRLRSTGGYEEAFDALVADLESARRLLT